MGREPDKSLDRRTFVKRGLAAGGLLAGAGLGIAKLADATQDSAEPSAPAPAQTRIAPTAKTQQPNILVILVDQLRFPAWFSPTADGSALR